MKKKILFLVFVLIFAFCAFAGADMRAFTQFGLSYGKVFSPANLGNNTTGLYDTAVFDAKAGLDFWKWADAYIGGAFDFFMDRPNMQDHYSFFPIFGGVVLNIMPDWVVYPSVMFEYGRAISDRYYLSGNSTVSNPWIADYYNYGFCVSWNLADIAILSFSVERPAISNMHGNGGEIHTIKTGLAWKIYY